MRQIALDTETTGISIENKHRIIEIGCVELIDRKLTGVTYHHYLNPNREIDAAAEAVHGITLESLKDKPTFNAISNEFMAFIQGAELIIHNAAFDLSFINYELSLLGQSSWKTITDHCQIIDTLQIARKLHAGQRNHLDALCKRYNIDYSKRKLHGALLDAHLLALVYLAMTGGQETFFDKLSEYQPTNLLMTTTIPEKQLAKLILLKATDQELAQHQYYLQDMLSKQGKCIWLEENK